MRDSRSALERPVLPENTRGLRPSAATGYERGARARRRRRPWRIPCFPHGVDEENGAHDGHIGVPVEDGVEKPPKRVTLPVPGLGASRISKKPAAMRETAPAAGDPRRMSAAARKPKRVPAELITLGDIVFCPRMARYRERTTGSRRWPILELITQGPPTGTFHP